MTDTKPLISLPILYSFRRCPYAMRARMAIRYSNIQVIIREVSLKDKPVEMLQASSKATVPVLVLNDGTVIDESLDIMRWALQQQDNSNWLSPLQTDEINSLIQYNDNVFKIHLDHYKYADRFPAKPQIEYRKLAEEFIQALENKLSINNFLLGNYTTLADVALFPFIRQFAYVDIKWLETSKYTNVYRWLLNWINSSLFLSVMEKHDPWNTNQQAIIL